jgi:hypothetical protein
MISLVFRAKGQGAQSDHILTLMIGENTNIGRQKSPTF